MFYKPVRILAHFEEISVLFGRLDLSAAVRTLAVNKLAFRPKTFARGAVHSLVSALVNIALLIKFFKYFLNGFHVIFVRRADKLVVADVHQIPYSFYFG